MSKSKESKESKGKDAADTPESARNPLDMLFAVSVPALMAITMLSFWTTNFTEIELYESRHVPIAVLSAGLTDTPFPTTQRIPSFRRGQTIRQKRDDKKFAAHVDDLRGKSMRYSELKSLHEKMDAQDIAWRMDFLRRHKLTIFRE